MPKYRVHAENEAGTSGEAPTFEADSPEEAEAEYLTWPAPLKVIKVELAPEEPGA